MAVLATLYLIPSLAAQVPAMPDTTTTAFLHVTVIPMDRERVLRDYTVLVHGGRITAMGRTDHVPIPATAVQVDGTGKYLLPGLADMHVHFAANKGMRWGFNSKIDTTLMLFTFIANGVTTVRDMHSGPDDKGEDWLLRLRQRITVGELLGPRIYAAGDPVYSSPAAAAQSVVALKAAGYDYVKYYWNQRPIYDSIAAAAHRVGLPLVAHARYAADNEGGMPLVFHDHWASVEHLIGYLEYAKGLPDYWGLIWRDADSVGRAALLRPVPDITLQRIARETKRAGVWNCPTLEYSRYITGSADEPVVMVAMRFYERMVEALQDAGAGLLLGTDANFLDGSLLWSGFGIHRELADLVAAGLSPYQALAMGTTNVARFLGTSDSTGTVAVGKRADLVLLRANPLVDIHNTAVLSGVMVAGRWLPRAELDERIERWPTATSDPDTAMWGTPAVQLRILARTVWR